MEKIIVTRHDNVRKYIIESGMVPENTPCYESIEKEFARGKHIYGIVPLELAAAAAKVTEVKITLRKNLWGKELSMDQIQACLKYVKTFVVTEEENE